MRERKACIDESKMLILKFSGMRNDKHNLIVEKTIDFSLSVIEYCEQLERDEKFVIANQLLRAATSIGANVFEAQDAESKADFIHKMKVAAKEANESYYWLTLCAKSKNYRFDNKIFDDLTEIVKILSKIISSAKKKSLGLAGIFPHAFSNLQIFKLGI